MSLVLSAAVVGLNGVRMAAPQSAQAVAQVGAPDEVRAAVRIVVRRGRGAGVDGALGTRLIVDNTTGSILERPSGLKENARSCGRFLCAIGAPLGDDAVGAPDLRERFERSVEVGAGMARRYLRADPRLPVRHHRIRESDNVDAFL